MNQPLPAMDELTSAVVETGRAVAGQEWGQPPKLYALAWKSELSPLGPHLPPGVAAAPDGALIPVEQDPLPEGEPAEVLASIRWPDRTAGCALVTELLVLPPEEEQKAPAEPAEAERWAPGRPGVRQGRLTVGVLRDGRYACCLQLRDEKELVIGNDLADDVVTALLGTF